ncbi:spore coat protein U domain-containing protein [Agrobacterium sp. a22-2]|uniref:Csu type fimbrial protein n=1 Tax=Agrobacterium sp. a22-2 TaxID=2283840 RepID=UPI0014466DE8|nr:spore coat protein U domain-containing protein [Agrobacterium sp. a22-2]NKN36437.1 spore coat protein U domain-containing protein [Agrobacterium sp. a22-2]
MRYADPRFLRAAIILTAFLSAVQVATITTASAASCNASVDALNFGNVDTLSGSTADGTAQVTISCDDVDTSETTVTVCANFGAGSGGASGSVRHMLSGGEELDYQLYGDSGRGASWGTYNDTTLGQPKTIQLSASDGTASGSVTVYGTVSAGQTSATTGSYLSSFSGSDASFYYAEGSSLDCAAPTTGTLTQADFTVDATVAANCLIEIEDIDFGIHGIIDTEVTATGGIDVTCTPGTTYSISMDGGLTGATDPEQRLMQSGSNTIAYGLYSDASHSTPWGSASANLVSGTGAGSVESLPVYGRVEPQSAAPGQYSDTVVVTITYY